jgi:hypothetical protein
MDISRDFLGHVLKINRAHEHLEHLEREIAAWFDGNKHFTHCIEPDPNEPTKLDLKLTADKIPIDPFSLIVGDIVHNIRSSLDYIAFELACANHGSLSQEEARSSQFPILGDVDKNGVSGTGPARFRSSSMIQYVSSSAQALIESVQPYHLGGKFREHPLWILNELVNIDKHRFLHIAAASLQELNISKLIMSKESLRLGETIIGEESTVVASFYNVRPIDPDTTVDMHITPKVGMAFGDGPYRQWLVHGTLGNVHTYVAQEVLMPLWKFFPEEIFRHDAPPSEIA